VKTRTETTPSTSSLPIALRLAQLARALPDLRGRDRLLAALIGAAGPLDATLAGTFGGGLRFEGNPAADGNVFELLLLRFARPALAVVLEAALASGSVFADVGANLGLYTLWAARLAGPKGQVHAFEPVPDVCERLTRNVALNGFAQVRIVPAGVGAEPGRITLYRHLGASGITSRYRAEQGPGIEVPVTTLDREFPPERRPPDLIKIDVEGMELEVLRGGRRLLAAAAPPLVVLEANHMPEAGIHYGALRSFLAETGGYELWALRSKGLRLESPEAETPGALNVLAARRDQPSHRRALERLARARFARNQNA
jgi:FkbM family methyltransferase